MLRLNQRVLESELMDQPGIDPAVHIKALQGIGRVNRISRIDRLLWKRLRTFQSDRDTPLRILDLACGGGDVLLKLADRATREKVPFVFEGADLSPTAVQYAQATAELRGLNNIRFFQHFQKIRRRDVVIVHAPFKQLASGAIAGTHGCCGDARNSSR
jgi:2-polyprenyl-3-methyl-5-hydroxy-6-metoxy-1,4-benzoquinol methylase